MFSVTRFLRLIHSDARIWSAILRIPNTRSEEEWVRLLLRNSATLVQPGYFYDFESEAWLVLSLLTPERIFEEGISRVLDAVRL